ncbi:MAG: hypothetical protein IJ716_06525 [Lachnospiraceae bacterium]|nr:hypothetical protein [Lachnospiraceae bacterium]
MDAKDINELKEAKDIIEKFKKLQAQKENPTREGMIKALSEAQQVAGNEIVEVEHMQGDVIPMLWSDFPDADLYRKLTQYQQGIYNHCLKKFGQEVVDKLMDQK